MRLSMSSPTICSFRPIRSPLFSICSDFALRIFSSERSSCDEGVVSAALVLAVRTALIQVSIPRSVTNLTGDERLVGRLVHNHVVGHGLGTAEVRQPIDEVIAGREEWTEWAIDQGPSVCAAA